jgi:hypothetical protein
MGNAQAAFSILFVGPVLWRADWAWGLPLIVLTVILHVLGLGLINQRVQRLSGNSFERHHPTAAFVLVIGTATLLAIFLHAMEAGIWSAAYRFLGALPDNKTAMLYSLGAITSYGHENVSLENQWQLMGAMEALNGWLLFGLTTAFLFGMIEKVGFLSRSGDRR